MLWVQAHRQTVWQFPHVWSSQPGQSFYSLEVKKKGGLLATALENSNNIDSIFGRLAIDSTLIVDTNAAARLNK